MVDAEGSSLYQQTYGPSWKAWFENWQTLGVQFPFTN